MNLTPDTQREMLRQMLTIRWFGERASADYVAGRIYGVVHCYIGEEAVAVGVCTALERGGRIRSTSSRADFKIRQAIVAVARRSAFPCPTSSSSASTGMRG
jgi:TPP-dependent pyruvate/acetoin dehydrogenase alpha subunit